MAETQRKYKGSLTFGQLDTALEAHEMLFGTITKLVALGEYTVATFGDAEYPPAYSLALMPLNSDNKAPDVASAKHLFDGEAMLMGVKVRVAVFRTK